MSAILDWWRQFETHNAFWDAFWPAVWGAVVGAGALSLLELRIARSKRINEEVGACNKLIFLLGQMLIQIENIHETMFVEIARRLGRDVQWNDIGALAGSPDEGPEFIIGEYSFLLEDDRNSESAAPNVLARTYNAEAKFRAALALLRERSTLWHEYNEYRAMVGFGIGKLEPELFATGNLLKARIKELTGWLQGSLVEAIAVMKAVIPDLRRLVEARYPKRNFIKLWPNDDPRAPPI